MEASTQGVPGYFVWQVPGQPAVVHLSVDVVDRMGADIMRGFGLVPKRGAEVGGILIGTVESNTIRIEDFEAVPCSYARGPSFLLTDAEREAFEEVCQRRGSEAIGYYRSHTREGLALQPEDIHLLERHFQLALLVKPFATKPGVAGFFIRDNSRENGVFPAATPLEFPFRRWEMTGEEPPRRAPMQERKRKEREPEKREPEKREPEKTREDVPAPPMSAIAPQRIFSMEPTEPPKESEHPGSKSRTGMWLVACFVFLLLGVLLGYEAMSITAPQRGASDFALSLAVERSGDNLTVRWNPKARAILSASNGELEIDDGSETKYVALDRANLSHGNFVYGTASNKVRFRLVLDLGSGLSVTETLDSSR